jgi:hypothetical protein
VTRPKAPGLCMAEVVPLDSVTARDRPDFRLGRRYFPLCLCMEWQGKGSFQSQIDGKKHYISAN